MILIDSVLISFQRELERRRAEEERILERRRREEEQRMQRERETLASNLLKVLMHRIQVSIDICY